MNGPLAVDLSDLQHHGCWHADRCVLDSACPMVTDCRIVEAGDAEEIAVIAPHPFVARMRARQAQIDAG